MSTTTKKPLFKPAMELPVPKLKRPTTEESAQKLLKPRPEEPLEPGYRKLTIYVRRDQGRKLKDAVTGFCERNPRAPKLSEAELFRMFLDQMPENTELDTLVKGYRG